MRWKGLVNHSLIVYWLSCCSVDHEENLYHGRQAPKMSIKAASVHMPGLEVTEDRSDVFLLHFTVNMRMSKWWPNSLFWVIKTFFPSKLIHVPVSEFTYEKQILCRIWFVLFMCLRSSEMLVCFLIVQSNECDSLQKFRLAFMSMMIYDTRGCGDVLWADFIDDYILGVCYYYGWAMWLKMNISVFFLLICNIQYIYISVLSMFLYLHLCVCVYIKCA